MTFLDAPCMEYVPIQNWALFGVNVGKYSGNICPTCSSQMTFQNFFYARHHLSLVSHLSHLHLSIGRRTLHEFRGFQRLRPWTKNVDGESPEPVGRFFVP